MNKTSTSSPPPPPPSSSPTTKTPLINTIWPFNIDDYVELSPRTKLFRICASSVQNPVKEFYKQDTSHFINDQPVVHFNTSRVPNSAWCIRIVCTSNEPMPCIRHVALMYEGVDDAVFSTDVTHRINNGFGVEIRVNDRDILSKMNTSAFTATTNVLTKQPRGVYKQMELKVYFIWKGKYYWRLLPFYQCAYKEEAYVDDDMSSVIYTSEMKTPIESFEPTYTNYGMLKRSCSSRISTDMIDSASVKRHKTASSSSSSSSSSYVPKVAATFPLSLFANIPNPFISSQHEYPRRSYENDVICYEVHQDMCPYQIDIYRWSFNHLPVCFRQSIDIETYDSGNNNAYVSAQLRLCCANGNQILLQSEMDDNNMTLYFGEKTNTIIRKESSKWCETNASQIHSILCPMILRIYYFDVKHCFSDLHFYYSMVDSKEIEFKAIKFGAIWTKMNGTVSVQQCISTIEIDDDVTLTLIPSTDKNIVRHNNKSLPVYKTSRTNDVLYCVSYDNNREILSGNVPNIVKCELWSDKEILGELICKTNKISKDGQFLYYFGLSNSSCAQNLYHMWRSNTAETYLPLILKLIVEFKTRQYQFQLELLQEYY